MFKDLFLREQVLPKLYYPSNQVSLILKFYRLVHNYLETLFVTFRAIKMSY